MKWIHTGRQLGQAVKNGQRLRQILSVFARNGFVDIVNRLHLGKFLPGRLGVFAESQGEIPAPERLRRAFEELGPTFVKLGQLLSTRSDLLPENYIEALVQLQDHVLPLAFMVVRAVIEDELGRTLEAAFAEVDPIPLAAASIGQVHGAVLHTGERVVIKVQRPEIARVIDTDVSLLAMLAGLLERYVPETRLIQPQIIVNEFFRTLSFELDFVVEANNIAKISENMRGEPGIVIPKVYKSHSTHRVLTLERLEGIRANDLKALEAAQVDRKAIVEAGARSFFKSVMIDGIFHGDLHGGNLFILPGNRLGVVDFGIVGRLSQRARDQLATMVVCLMTEDYENLCYEYAELGAADASVDFDHFQREVRNALSPYLGLAIADMNLGKILIEATKIATRYRIQVPGDWMLVFKAILTLEGMARSLDPEFDLMTLGQDLAKGLTQKAYSTERLTKELGWVLKDLAGLGKVLPRQIRWMFRKFNRNDFAFEIKSEDLRLISRQVDRGTRRLTLGVMAGALFVAGSLSLSFQGPHLLHGYPLLSVVELSAGCVLLLRSMRIR